MLCAHQFFGLEVERSSEMARYIEEAHDSQASYKGDVAIVGLFPCGNQPKHTDGF